MKEKILIIGACGQIGRELVDALRDLYTQDAVIAADILSEQDAAALPAPYVRLDATDKVGIQRYVRAEKVTQIYLLAAILSAKGEQNTALAWNVNMQSLLNIMEIAREENLKKVFWPSSIAVFGPFSPRENCPQHTVTEPTTVYGISKCAGEYWCNYYFEKHGIDVRSIRYPGLISYKTAPGGGTTDYAVDIFHSAAKGEAYQCFLKEDTELPMMYMPDAIRATIELMEAPANQIKIRTAYNLSGMSFTPAELTESIQKHLPEFKVKYAPDFRQQIADSWPRSIDDCNARQDWQWLPQYDLNAMTADMLSHLSDQQMNQ